MSLTKKERQLIGNLLTIDDVCKLFSRRPMTIYNWINQLGMPTVAVDNYKAAKRFDFEELRQWATKNNKLMYYNKLEDLFKG